MDKNRILIIGSGYVGLTVGIALASFGNHVIIHDKDEYKLDLLQKGNFPIYEPLLSEMFESNKSNIVFMHDISRAIKESHILFITVGTELVDGNLSLTNFYEAIASLEKHLEPGKIVVIKSTVPVGTTDNVRERLQKIYGKEIIVAVNPEFLREGNAVNDFLYPERIIIGVEHEEESIPLLQLYSKIDAPKLVVDFKTAEMIKYTSNVFLATKISFINEIANLCDLFGIDVTKVAEGVGLDRRIGKDFLKAGIGFGGSCLPKDLMTLIKISENVGYNPTLLKSVKEINEGQVRRFVYKVISVLGQGRGILGVWGLSFKGGTDDVRFSPSIEIVKMLNSNGFRVNVYDPKAIENGKKVLGNSVDFYYDPIETVKNTDALLVLTDWPEFLEVDLSKVAEVMNKRYLFDARNIFDPMQVRQHGFSYFGVGRKNV